MNMWERLKEQVKDTFKKTEPVIEKEPEVKEKEPEEIIVTVPARVAGVYNLYSEYTKKDYFSYQRMERVDYEIWCIHMNVKAMVELTVNGVKSRFKIEDTVELIEGKYGEDSLYKFFMSRTDERKKELIEEGLNKLVIKTFNDNKLKDYKEQFQNLGKVEFDIKIEVNEEKLQK
ncbi:hypothetical protein PQE74_gp170 [Bacillus phage vB_BanS_Chewbecca]|uniref:Uncharacterized protein n=1 Tax=Bacillus phage vB_BanS_Chewbecca TaxID=2894786 RepID=A0AAE8YNA9_9CAUD|nr:hypothetical protein PQE74_gp170 [Bacillus phage vB_BanS_Chewbecca]UGO46253.1 hypothetical protein CHEWBECCA_170 [Bacillus phage vB_BanS_Chewbecca]